MIIIFIKILLLTECSFRPSDSVSRSARKCTLLPPLHWSWGVLGYLLIRHKSLQTQSCMFITTKYLMFTFCLFHGFVSFIKAICVWPVSLQLISLFYLLFIVFISGYCGRGHTWTFLVPILHVFSANWGERSYCELLQGQHHLCFRFIY